MDYGSGAPDYQPPLPDAAAITALRGALLSNPSELDRIASLPRAAAITALCTFAKGSSIGIAIEALTHFLTPEPLHIARSVPHDVTAKAPPSHYWLPIGLGTDGTQAVVNWAHFGTSPLDGPFFEQHLRRAYLHPISQLYGWCTPLGSLTRNHGGGRVLNGLVFHMSRCGSTLVAQTLAAMPGHLVLSEPAPFDELLQFCAAHQEMPMEVRVALLRGMVADLASERGRSVRRRFLKTDCWHAGALPLLRAAFPETPWIFLYRDPREVLMSHDRVPGGQTVPGPHAALVGIDDPAALPGPDFTARLLAATCHMAADHADIGGGIFIDYAELPQAFLARILPHFGIVPDAAELAAISSAMSRDAKEPFKRYDPHERAPRQTASGAVIAASDRHLAVAVERLRALNHGISG